MSKNYEFHEVARLPLPGDNVAIATRRLEAGTAIRDDDHTYVLSTTILEGHRFAVQPIAKGASLLSWQLPFGVATQSIAPGEYVCNQAIIEALSMRNLDFELPAAGNFGDRIEPYLLNTGAFQAAKQVPAYEQARYFHGYRRPGSRGVGTRNVIVLLGTTSRTGSFVKQLEERTRHLALEYPNVDGIVAVAHTEGGSGEPNNRELLLRTLAGFMVHPNVGAVLAVDYGVEPVTNRHLQAYLQAHAYPIESVPHAFLSLTGPFLDNLARGEETVRSWLKTVNDDRRTQESVSNLKIALQCGGSDAFSGISRMTLTPFTSAA